MYCLANLISGNYAFNLCKALESKGYVFEVVATPCQIASGGCGFSLKFPSEYTNLVIKEGTANSTPVREIYKIVPMFSKNKYERIY